MPFHLFVTSASTLKSGSHAFFFFIFEIFDFSLLWNLIYLRSVINTSTNCFPLINYPISKHVILIGQGGHGRWNIPFLFLVFLSEKLCLRLNFHNLFVDIYKI